MEKNTLKYSFLRADWFYSLAGYREIKASKASDRANLTPNSISFVFASSHTHTHIRLFQIDNSSRWKVAKLISFSQRKAGQFVFLLLAKANIFSALPKRHELSKH